MDPAEPDQNHLLREVNPAEPDQQLKIVQPVVDHQQEVIAQDAASQMLYALVLQLHRQVVEQEEKAESVDPAQPDQLNRQQADHPYHQQPNKPILKLSSLRKQGSVIFD